MATVKIDLTTSLVDISSLGRGRQFCWSGASPDFRAQVEVADSTGSLTTVIAAIAIGTGGVVSLPTDASVAASYALLAGSVGSIWVQGDDGGASVLDLTTALQDVSTLAAGREVFLAGAPAGLVVAIEIARSVGASTFVEVGRLSRDGSISLPNDASVAMRYRVVGGVVGPNTKVWVCAGEGTGGGGALAGDVIGPTNNNVVKSMSGSGGFVTMPAGTTIQQTQAVADATMIPLQIVTETGHSLFFLLQGAGVDDTFSWGWDAKGQGGEAHYGNYTQERLFAGAQEAYQEFDGVFRPWFASFVDSTTALTVVFESSQDGGVVIQDFTSNVATGMASFTKASSTVDGGTVNLGSDAHTTQTVLHASTAHFRQMNGVTMDQLSVSGGNAQVTIGASLATYGFEGVAGQALFMQANGVGALVNLDSTRVLLTSAGTKLDINNTGIAVLGAAPSARINVTGSRGGNAALASLLTAMATFGWITDSTSA